MGSSSIKRTPDVVIVGAGFAGMYLLHLLRSQGLSAQVFEAGTGVGGTWYWNRYPGARCDVRSIDYSYSFDADLEQTWEWSEKFATQPELLQYANHVADRHDLRSDIAFETRVVSARYAEDSARWTVGTDAGDSIEAQFLVMATGCLSVSKAPEVAGLDDFDGPTFHTGHWPHEGVDFTGQRVGVVGTGSSGIQAIPVIAAQAASVTVFQRTPNFSMPAHHGPNDPDELATIKADYPDYRERQRRSAGGTADRPIPTKSALEVSDDERNASMEAGWQKGGLAGITSLYNDVRINQESNDLVAAFVHDKIRGVVEDPEVAELLCPDDHPLGTKRPCVDDGYYSTFNQDHVRLVDLRSTPIERLTPAGLTTSAESFEFDAVVFATGFDAMTGALDRVDIRGRNGRLLREKWAAGPRSYLGLMVADFPNFFTVTGPGSPSVLSNMMVSIEQHVEWITDCFVHLRDEDKQTIEPTLEAEDEWVAHVVEVGDATLFPKANSWYMGANVPGKPRVFLPYVGGVGVYREICEDVVANGYRGFALTD